MRLDRRGIAFGALLLGMVLLAPSGWAHDDDRKRSGRHDAGRDRDVSVYGQEYGYEDGMRHGAQDRARRVGYDYKSDHWRHADRGYQRHFGSRGQYRKAYRAGYERGYADAYNGHQSGGWGWGRRDRDRDGDWRRRDGDWGRDRDDDWNRRGGNDSRYLIQVAQQNGYQDGVHYGEMDRRNGHSNRPTEVKGYRDADHGYDRSLGSRDDFKRIYRDAFIRGYQQGYGTYYGRRR